MKRSKALFRPDRAARLINQLINTAGDAVVNEIQHFTVRVKVETKLRFVRQFLMQIFNWRRNIQQQQATQTTPHSLLLFLRVIKKLNRYAVTLIHQRRPGLHFVVATFLLVVIR